MTSSIISTHLGTPFHCYIRYILLNTLFSAILALHEIKLIDGVNYCHLRAQFNEKTIITVFLNIKYK